MFIYLYILASLHRESFVVNAQEYKAYLKDFDIYCWKRIKIERVKRINWCVTNKVAGEIGLKPWIKIMVD